MVCYYAFSCLLGHCSAVAMLFFVITSETSRKDFEAFDMAAMPVPLTVEVLESELEKSRRGLTEECTALLNSSLSPLQTSLDCIHSI